MLLEPYWLRLVTMVVFDFGKVMFHLVKTTNAVFSPGFIDAKAFQIPFH
jgi:hypothetical protein